MKKSIHIVAMLLVFGGFWAQAQEKAPTQDPTNCKLIAPNAFTPNNDGVNDYFRLSVKADCEVLQYDFKIFDRWGRMVFEADEVLTEWDGTYDGQQLKEGVYLWQASIVWRDDTRNKGQTETKKGTLVLIR